MNNDNNGWIDLGNTAITGGTNSITYNVDSTSAFSYTTNTTWNLNNYYTWPKGISDYSFEKKYAPKWHILLGYKNQMDSMWD